MAPMGNVGKALGTPVLAAALAGSGAAGLFVAVAAALCLGGAVHLWLGTRRRR